MVVLSFHQIRKKKFKKSKPETIKHYNVGKEGGNQPNSIYLLSVSWISYPHKAFFSSWSCCSPVSLLCERVAAGNVALCSHPKDSVEWKKKWYIHEAHQHKINCLLCKTQSHQNCQKKGTNYCNLKGEKKKKETSRNNVILHLPATLKWQSLENFKIHHAAALFFNT